MPLDVDEVIAHAVYDPVARRERYLKERRLKGRPTGVKIGQGSRIVDANTPIGSSRHYPSVNVTQIRQEASAARQIAGIKTRLASLKAHLKELLAKKAATEKSSTSSSSESKSSTQSKTTNTTQTKPKTAKQKQAAKESIKKAQQASAQKQKATPNAKPDLTLDEQIKRTRAVIADVTTKLKTVEARVKNQTASNGR